MLDLSIINNEIDFLEQEETTFEVCDKLADLYIVRDHLMERQLSTDGKSVVSEFMAAAIGADIPSLMRIIDEHMDAIRVIYPKEYEAVVSKIRSLHSPH